MYLRNLRVKAGLTQGEVAKALGFSTCQFVSNWERGLCGMPAAHFKTLSKLYKVEVKTLIKYKARAYMDRIIKATEGL